MRINIKEKKVVVAHWGEKLLYIIRSSFHPFKDNFQINLWKFSCKGWTENQKQKEKKISEKFFQVSLHQKNCSNTFSFETKNCRHLCIKVSFRFTWLNIQEKSVNYKIEKIWLEKLSLQKNHSHQELSNQNPTICLCQLNYNKKLFKKGKQCYFFT